MSFRAATIALVVGCLALGATSALELRLISTVHGALVPWDEVLLSTTPRWLLLAAVLPLALRLAYRYPVVPLSARVAALHAGAFLLLSVVHAQVNSWALGLAAPMTVVVFSWTARITRSWLSAMPILACIYGAILVAAWAMVEARERQERTLRASKLEAQLHAARLAALRAQLHPHFLYNTLNGIAALVADHQPSRAVAAIEQLGELLHASLREDGRDVITIGEEVELAAQYLALQQLRFGARLHCAFQIAPAVRECLVPVLLLQPAVENAVVHGLDAGQDTLHVVIVATDTPDGVQLRVENDGPGLGAGPHGSPGHGVGLASTRARLETAYGKDVSLSLTARAGGGVVVTMLVPRVMAAPGGRVPQGPVGALQPV